MIGQAPDSTLTMFVKSIARNAMLINSAREQHIKLTAADDDSIRKAYRSDLSDMIQRLGVSADSLAADTAARRDRAVAVARRVQTFFNDVVASSPRHTFFDVQPFLADVLRGRYSWSISPAGVDRVLAKAQQLRGPTAPAQAAGPSGEGATQRAPGGPPMGAQPPAAKAPAPNRPTPRP